MLYYFLNSTYFTFYGLPPNKKEFGKPLSQPWLKGLNKYYIKLYCYMLTEGALLD